MRHNQRDTHGVRIGCVHKCTVVCGLAECCTIAGAVSTGAVLATGAVGVREACWNVYFMGRDEADVDAGVAVIQGAFD